MRGVQSRKRSHQNTPNKSELLKLITPQDIVLEMLSGQAWYICGQVIKSVKDSCHQSDFQVVNIYVCFPSTPFLAR